MTIKEQAWRQLEKQLEALKDSILNKLGWHPYLHLLWEQNLYWLQVVQWIDTPRGSQEGGKWDSQQDRWLAFNQGQSSDYDSEMQLWARIQEFAYVRVCLCISNSADASQPWFSEITSLYSQNSHNLYKQIAFRVFFLVSHMLPLQYDVIILLFLLSLFAYSSSFHHFWEALHVCQYCIDRLIAVHLIRVYRCYIMLHTNLPAQEKRDIKWS